MDRVMAALGRSDRIGAAGVVGAGDEAVVAALAVGLPDRMDRREVENVEAHRLDRRQAADHVAEGAVPAGIIGDRAREQLVPAGEPGGLAIRLHREDALGPGRMRARIGLRHRAGQCP